MGNVLGIPVQSALKIEGNKTNLELAQSIFNTHILKKLAHIAWNCEELQEGREKAHLIL